MSRVETSAGALVYKKTRRGVSVAMVKDSFGKWTFPKGHVRRGERLTEAAVRECREELGVTGPLFPQGKLGTIDIWFTDRFVHVGERIHKFIHYFFLEAMPQAHLRRPLRRGGEGERIAAVAWIAIEELSHRSAYRDVDHIVSLALKRLRFL
jgi:8-oxo-dGTP pyrophosphatase MutT (NUDIX family)